MINFERNFNNSKIIWDKVQKSLPKIEYNKEFCNEMFVGDIDKDGYIEWKPIRQKKKVDFQKIETTFDIVICSDVKSYINTYYFPELMGGTEEYNLFFPPIASEKDVERLVYNIINSHTNIISFGIEENGYTVFINYESGQVYIEKDSNNLIEIAPQLSDVI